MSMYKLLRASALTTLLVKYRVKLFRAALAAAFALVTAWGYGDVAAFLESRHPDMLWLALVLKSLIIYAALFYAFWQFRPSAAEGNSEKTAGRKAGAADKAAIEHASAGGPSTETPRFDRLDALADLKEKPSLKSRKEAILENDGKHG